jgi:ATP-dependent Lon protease
VLFVTTANLLDPIQPAFLDRMEVLRLSGYTLEEKIAIARRHLLPKQLVENGLTEQLLEMPDATLRRIVQAYTREAGLRSFERELGGVCRKVAVRVAEGKTSKSKIGPKSLDKLLGQPRYLRDELLERDRVGVATGLAWTGAGGELMFIEVLATPGKGQLVLTGQLGDVMKESAQAALSFARSWASRHPEMARMEFFSHNDLHVHVPAGAIPKDGPSAGITIAAAIVSAMTGRKVDRRLAMTGEITLRGEVLAIGGLKEKLLAAQAAGIRAVLLPKLNRRDLDEVPESARQELSLTLVESMEEVLQRALLPGARPAAAPNAPAARRGDLRVARPAERESGRRVRAADPRPKRRG